MRLSKTGSSAIVTKTHLRIDSEPKAAWPAPFVVARTMEREVDCQALLTSCPCWYTSRAFFADTFYEILNGENKKN